MWDNTTRKETLPPNWETEIRPRILTRDNHQCTWRTHGHRCTRPATDVDHIGDRNDHRDHNLRSLCAPHHAHRSAHQGGKAAAQAQAQRKARKQRPHPGLITPQHTKPTR